MDFVVSVFGHSMVIAVLVLLPLYFTQAIHMPQFEKTLPVAPPPPAAVHVMPRVPKSFFAKGQLFAPKFIPKKVAEIKEEASPPAPSGVAGGVIGRNRSRAGTASARSRRSQRALPRGRVDPPLARQARVQGDVIIDSVIDTEGKVTQMKVVSGARCWSNLRFKGSSSGGINQRC